MLQRVLPAVVSVHSEQHAQVSPFGNDPIFSRLFPQLTQDRINQSLGSGVIVDAQKGYVLTNHHVIEGADAVSVTLSDGRTLKAEFLGSGSRHRRRADAHEAQDLTAIPLGNTAARCAWAISWSRSAIRSGSADGDLGIVSAVGAATCPAPATRTSSRPTRRSIPAIPAARW